MEFATAGLSGSQPFPAMAKAYDPDTGLMKRGNRGGCGRRLYAQVVGKVVEGDMLELAGSVMRAPGC
jgi:hypothetical protein